MEGPKILYGIWILALVAFIAMSFNGTTSTTDFQGIADSREVVVNSDNAVEIKNFHVVPGQTVQPGDLIVELERPELTMQINEISHELEQTRSDHSVNEEEIKASIRQLKAQEAAELNSIDSQIKQLASKKSFNRELTTGLKSIQQTGSSKGAESSPIELEIESLTKERELTKNRFEVEIESLQATLKTPENSLSIRAQSLEKELSLLEKEEEKLLIYAQISGVIGSVPFKTGEKVSPFVPILTMYTKAPSYVKGYIHENLYNQVAVGEKVAVTSLAGNGGGIFGEVVGIGSRIVEYPERLRKRADVQMWGREVEIRIPEENAFLLGEKVMIRSTLHQKNSWAILKGLWEKGISYLAGNDSGNAGQSIL